MLYCVCLLLVFHFEEENIYKFLEEDVPYHEDKDNVRYWYQHLSSYKGGIYCIQRNVEPDYLWKLFFLTKEQKYIFKIAEENVGNFVFFDISWNCLLQLNVPCNICLKSAVYFSGHLNFFHFVFRVNTKWLAFLLSVSTSIEDNTLIGFSEFCLRKELVVPELQLCSVIEQAADTVVAWQEMIVPYESVIYHY